MNIKDKIGNVIFDSAAVLLLVMSATQLLSTALFLVGMSINMFTLPASVLCALCMYYCLNRNRSAWESTYGVVLALFVFILFVYISGNIFDLSFDGSAYQKASMGSLAHGWNPIYSSLEDFAAIPDGVSIASLGKSAIWADHYCKAPWIAGANIYSFTGNVETAKAINLIFAYILFAFVYHYLSDRFFSIPVSVAISLLTVLNPIVIPQIFTLYIDGLLACSLFTVIILLCGFADREYSVDKNVRAVCLFCAIVWCINIKFTGLAYAAIFCFSFYVLSLVRAYREKNLADTAKKLTLFYVVTVLCAVLLAGSADYVKNTVQHGHPFYPLFGEGKVDIMAANSPAVFKDMSGPERLYNSLFSEVSNLIGEGEIRIKRPFTYISYEVDLCGLAPDLRLSGMGVYFSGILLVSLVVLVLALVFLAVRCRKHLGTVLCIILPTLALLLFTGESWWARYSPHMWFFPVLAIIFACAAAKKAGAFLKLPALALVGFLGYYIIVNCHFFTAYPLRCSEMSEKIDKELSALSLGSAKEPVMIAYTNPAFYGIEYNFKDYGINYIITGNIENGTEFFGGKAVVSSETNVFALEGVVS